MSININSFGWKHQVFFQKDQLFFQQNEKCGRNKETFLTKSDNKTPIFLVYKVYEKISAHTVFYFMWI